MSGLKVRFRPSSLLVKRFTAPFLALIFGDVFHQRVKSGHERQRAMYQGESSGDWNSGKQLVGVVPQVGHLALYL